MRVVVCGSRVWTNMQVIKETLDKYHLEKIVVGDASGADTLVVRYAIENNIPYQIYKADWNSYGKAAGPRRNKQMLETQPQLVIGFLLSTEPNKGTLNTLSQARRMNIPSVEIWQ